MNHIIDKFCEVESYAISIYNSGYKPKDEIYDILESKFGKRYNNVLLIALEAAAESFNFHKDTGPWMRDLREKAGHFTSSELRLARQEWKSTTPRLKP